MEQVFADSSKSRIRLGIAGIVLLIFLFSIPYFLLLAGSSVFKVANIRGLLSHEIYVWLMLAVMFLFAYKVEKQRFLPMDDSFNPYRWYLRNFIRLIFFMFMLSWFVQLLVKFMGLSTQSLLITKLKPILHAHKPVVLLMALTAGVTEELLVRGYVFSRLELLFKKPEVAIFGSAVFFSLLHISYGTLSNMLFPFFMGVLFSAHYYKYRNIKVLIMCHFFWDLLSIGIVAG